MLKETEEPEPEECASPTKSINTESEKTSAHLLRSYESAKHPTKISSILMTSQEVNSVSSCNSPREESVVMCTDDVVIEESEFQKLPSWTS